MNKVLFLLFFYLPFIFVGSLSAQQYELRGQVTDSLKVGIAGAVVRIYTSKDSLSTGTSKSGNFIVRAVSREDITLVVRSLGYQTYRQNLHYTGTSSIYELPPIVLQSTVRRLQEVQVRVPSPIRVGKDTVEYNAAAYPVGEHDRLEDLLRQLPGVRVDGEGNVTAMGQSMTKLRVNGKDFFTNNVKDFLKQLPAGIIAKLQVIDDYGDQANFTGIKTGKPQKMLNLVIKDGQNRGIFGNMQSSASTQDLFGAGFQGNVWLDVHQVSGYANHQNARVEGGSQQTTTMGTNYRRSMDRLNVYGSYGYNATHRKGSFESYSESGTSNGILYNRLQNNNSSENQNQQLQFSVQSRRKRDFWNLQVVGQVAQGNNQTHSISKQTGAIVQDLDNTLLTDSKNSNGKLSLSWSRLMEKQGRSLTASFSATAQGGQDRSTIHDKLRFYNQVTSQPVKDSVSTRLLDADRGESQFDLSAQYTEPLNDHNTANTKRSLDIGYRYSRRRNDKLQQTKSAHEGVLVPVDSLNTDFRTVFNTQQLDLSYRGASPKLDYNFGLSMVPTRMSADESLQQRDIAYHMFRILPIASVRYAPSLKNNIQLNYSGTASPPSVDQLIPLQDIRNLQQITVGNPDLKPTLTHGLSLSLNHINPVKGDTYSLGLNANLTQDQVVANVLLVPDTLNSFKQETHYVNANGAYNLNASYDMTLPFATYYQLQWSTSGSKNRSIVFIGGQNADNSTISLRQSLGVALNSKKIRGSVNLNYSCENIRYELNNDLNRRTYTWETSSNARWTISSRLAIGADASYRINGGYTIPIKNPIMLNASTELFLFANKELSLQLFAYDLLDQQQSIYMLVTPNSVTQRTQNRIGRYIQLTAQYNLSHFGVKNKKN
ncbi:TonB-dependent receptor [Sphingobacterium faecium]|uniref:TonB-dependent receptor n=1 Tax=Sphingobacterium faecium TaxID=34087 RepID=UPI003207FA2B